MDTKKKKTRWTRSCLHLASVLSVLMAGGCVTATDEPEFYAPPHNQSDTEVAPSQPPPDREPTPITAEPAGPSPECQGARCEDDEPPGFNLDSKQDALDFGTVGGDAELGEQGPCDSEVLTFSLPLMAPDGPTEAFEDAYNAELAALPAGPAAFEIHGADSTDREAHNAQFCGVESSGGYFLTPVEAPAEVDIALSRGDGSAVTLSIAREPAEFSLVFGDTLVRVSELEAQGTLNPGCGDASYLQLHLYVHEGEGDKELDETTLRDLLGPPDQSIGEGTNNGWCLTLSGATNQGELQ